MFCQHRINYNESGSYHCYHVKLSNGQSIFFEKSVKEHLLCIQNQRCFDVLRVKAAMFNIQRRKITQFRLNFDGWLKQKLVFYYCLLKGSLVNRTLLVKHLLWTEKKVAFLEIIFSLFHQQLILLRLGQSVIDRVEIEIPVS